MKKLIIGLVGIGLPWLVAEDERSPLHEYEASLEVHLPYATILPAEIFPVSFELTNKGDEPIRVITGGLNDSLQLVWIPWRDGKSEKRSGALLTSMYRESPVETFRDTNLDIYETKEIGPGETFEADRVFVRTLSWNLPEDRSETEFRPAFYGGKGKIIYGDPFKIKFVPKSLKSFQKVFETTFTAGGTRPIPFEIYEIPINGETYLFNNTGIRFCRIPPGSKYSVSFQQLDDPLEYSTTVIFDDPSLEPHVFSWRQYQLVSASRETVPWLFNKSGEGAVDAGNRASKDGPAPRDETRKGGAPDPVPPAFNGKERITGRHEASDGHRLVWPWIVSGCLFAGFLVLLGLHFAGRKNGGV